MIRTKQLPVDRLRRLKDGRCPIHGLFMTQVGVCEAGMVVECPRDDCAIQALDDGHPMTSESLMPEFQHLLRTSP